MYLLLLVFPLFRFVVIRGHHDVCENIDVRVNSGPSVILPAVNEPLECGDDEDDAEGCNAVVCFDY